MIFVVLLRSNADFGSYLSHVSPSQSLIMNGLTLSPNLCTKPLSVSFFLRGGGDYRGSLQALFKVNFEDCGVSANVFA